MPVVTFQLRAVQNVPAGTYTTAARAVPANFVKAELNINCTTLNPASPFTGFVNPFSSLTDAIEFSVSWSWDGGVTFPGLSTAIQNGRPDGIWGVDPFTHVATMTPNLGVTLPFASNLGGAPTHYRAMLKVSPSTITFGLTLKETTA